jgi:cell division protein FtsB
METTTKTELTKMKTDFILVLIIVGVVTTLFIGITIVVIFNTQNSDVKTLNERIQYLESENQTLQHNIDIITGGFEFTPQENSQELELLNTLGEAIQNSKSVDLTIDTQNGKIHFIYEAK